jgi:hypothetical protein
MRKVIYKYVIGGPKVIMPKGAKVLSVQNQGDEITLWALVDPDEAFAESRFFAIVGTGQNFPYAANMQFIGTVQVGSYVFHVFEVANVYETNP